MKLEKQGTPEPFAALNRIPIHDNLETLVDVRLFCPKVKLNPGVIPYLREGVAKMLNIATSLLPPGHYLRLHTALRTIEIQTELYWRHYRELEEIHPEWPTSALRRANNKYYAAPDAKAPPGHCTGGAVDVTIVSPDGHNLDMTSPTERWEGAYTYSTLLCADAHYNRQMLIKVMFEAGFSNCRDEWWHWSYGDSAWAVRTGNKKACYGHMAPPACYTKVGPIRPTRRIARQRSKMRVIRSGRKGCRA